MFYDLCPRLTSPLRVWALMWRKAVRWLNSTLAMTHQAPMELNPEVALLLLTLAFLRQLAANFQLRFIAVHSKNR